MYSLGGVGVPQRSKSGLKVFEDVPSSRKKRSSRETSAAKISRLESEVAEWRRKFEVMSSKVGSLQDSIVSKDAENEALRVEIASLRSLLPDRSSFPAGVLHESTNDQKHTSPVKSAHISAKVKTSSRPRGGLKAVTNSEINASGAGAAFPLPAAHRKPSRGSLASKSIFAKPSVPPSSGNRRLSNVRRRHLHLRDGLTASPNRSNSSSNNALSQYDEREKSAPSSSSSAFSNNSSSSNPRSQSDGNGAPRLRTSCVAATDIDDRTLAEHAHTSSLRHRGLSSMTESCANLFGFGPVSNPAAGRRRASGVASSLSFRRQPHRTPVLRGRGNSSHLPAPSHDLSRIDSLLSASDSSTNNKFAATAKSAETSLPHSSAKGPCDDVTNRAKGETESKKRRKTGFCHAADSKAERAPKKQKTDNVHNTDTRQGSQYSPTDTGKDQQTSISPLVQAKALQSGDSSTLGVESSSSAQSSSSNVQRATSLSDAEANWWRTIDEQDFSNPQDALGHTVDKTLEAWRSHRLYTEYRSNDACFDRGSFKLSACHNKLFAEDPKFSIRSSRIVDFSGADDLHTLDLTSQKHRTKFPLAHTVIDSIVNTCVAPDKWSALCKLNFRGTLVDGETVGRFAEVPRFCAQITHLDVGHTFVAEDGIAHIAKLRGLRHLGLAGLRYVSLEWASVSALASQCVGLETLCLDGCEKFSTGDSLVRLQPLSRLKRLGLNIRDLQAFHLRDFLLTRGDANAAPRMRCRIERLHLSAQQMSDVLRKLQRPSTSSGAAPIPRRNIGVGLQKRDLEFQLATHFGYKTPKSWKKMKLMEVLLQKTDERSFYETVQRLASTDPLDIMKL